MIYIARDHDGYTLSIVVAPVRRDAELFWQGKGLIPHFIEEQAADDAGTPLGIKEILKTKTEKDLRSGREKIVVAR